MNEVLAQLIERKSTRAFEQKEIPAADREAILWAAAQAPTAGNQQLYTILNIADQSIKESFARSCDNQPFIAKAPFVLIFCADCAKWYDAYREAGCEPRDPGAGDLMLAVTDCAIVAQNAVVAAHSLGIGSCYIGDIMERCEEHRELLNLPPTVFPVVMLVFGYPTEQQRGRTKPARCDMRHIVHTDRYRRMDGGELREMFAHKCGAQSFEGYMSAFCDRKYNSDFAREMTRSVEMYLRSFVK